MEEQAKNQKEQKKLTHEPQDIVGVFYRFYNMLMVPRQQKPCVRSVIASGGVFAGWRDVTGCENLRVRHSAASGSLFPEKRV